MYINFKLIEQRAIKPEVILLMQAIKQNAAEDLSVVIEHLNFHAWVDFLEDNGYIKFNKPKRSNEDLLRLVRLTTKGNNFLDDISTPDVEDIDIVMANHFMEVYIKKGEQLADINGGMNDRTIGNRKKTVMYIAQFRKILGLSPKQMYYLCLMFISEYTYTKVLEKVFFDSNKNRYGTFKNNLEDSKLYQYYTENKEKVQEYWRQKIKEE